MGEAEARRDPQLAREFAELARLVKEGGEVDEVFRSVCELAVSLVDGVQHAAVSVLRHGQMHTAAATGQWARRLDDLQRETGEGPCLDAMVDEAWEHQVDLASLDQPTVFQRRVREETPLRSLLAFRLIRDDRKAGALNLASDRPHAFDDAAAEQAAILASFASVACEAADARQRAGELAEGLQTNREIGAAVGILMASHRISGEEAFGVLRRASQEMNRKLRLVARELVEATERGSRPSS